MVSGHVWQFQFVAIKHLEVHIKVDNYNDYVIMSPDTGEVSKLDAPQVQRRTCIQQVL